MRWTLVIVAFLLGSIPFGFLLYRLRTGGDLRRSGSGNIGATNVLRSAGKTLGLLTLLLDAAKGWLALWLGLRVAPGNTTLLSLILLAVIAGHMYTPWLRFHGGKGVATALGAFLAWAPLPLAGAIGVFLIVLGIWRYVSLASICATLALPLLLAPLSPRPVAPAEIAAASLAAALILWRHRANMERLRHGTEHKFGRRLERPA
jgi:glycerol-3-phosphate acyltransferase PlsY